MAYNQCPNNPKKLGKSYCVGGITPLTLLLHELVSFLSFITLNVANNEIAIVVLIGGIGNIERELTSLFGKHWN